MLGILLIILHSDSISRGTSTYTQAVHHSRENGPGPALYSNYSVFTQVNLSAPRT